MVKKVPAIIFADESYAKPEKLVAEIVNYYETQRILAIEQFDLICINRKYVLVNCSDYSPYSSVQRGIYWIESGEDSLAEFLLRLSMIDQCEPIIAEPIIPLYLKTLDRPQIKYIVELNKRLESIDAREVFL